MVDRVEIFEVADAIAAEGGTPSIRAVRKRLRRKGSYSDIGPMLSEWYAERNFRPRPTAADLPERLAGSLASLAAEVWRDGHREGLLAAQNELGRVIAERDAARTALAEAFAMVDGLEKRVGLLEKGVTVEAAELSLKLSGKIKFWKSVMEEITALLGDRRLTAAQIIAEMSPVTKEKAKEADPSWCPANLADRMRGRARKQRYFEEPAQGVFCRLRSLEGPKPKTAK